MSVWRPQDGIAAQERTMISEGKWQAGRVSWLHAIALDSKGNIYLGGIKDGRAQKYVTRG